MVDLSKYDKKSIGKLFDLAVYQKTPRRWLRKGAKDAIAYNTNVFQVANPFYLPVVVEELKARMYYPHVVLLFPFGSTTTYVKAKEVEQAVKLGR